MDSSLYPGPFCQQIGLRKDSFGQLQKKNELKNGVIIELVKFAASCNIPSNKVEEWICIMQPEFRFMNKSTLKSKIKSTYDVYKKFVAKKRSTKYRNVSEFNNDVFLAPPSVVEKYSKYLKDCTDSKLSVTNRLSGTEAPNPTAQKCNTESQLSAINPLSETETPNPTAPKCNTESQLSATNPLSEKETPNPTAPKCTTDSQLSATNPLSETETPNPPAPKCNTDSQLSATNPLSETETPNPTTTKCNTDSQLSTTNPLSETETPNATAPQCTNSQFSVTISPDEIFDHISCDDSVKQLNLIKYEIIKEQKKLKRLQKLTHSEQENLARMKETKGHFSVRNVTKRDENAMRIRKNLRTVQSQSARQKQEIELLNSGISELKNCLYESQQTNVDMKAKFEAFEEVQRKKTNAQKLNSYYRNTVKQLRESQNTTQDDLLKNVLRNKEVEIENLRIENDILKETLSEKQCGTKNTDGSFTNKLRMCVIELFGLEIAVEKISSAINAVALNLFGVEFEKNDLPNKTTVQNIIDEGHYIAKLYIAEQIEEAESWGLNRDGTTRKKKKILDTSVTLDSGDILSLGFTTVAHETAVAITDATKTHINELALAHSDLHKTDKSPVPINENYIMKSLEKLSFTMTDRASNEKKADKLLTEWRDDILKDCENEEEKKTVHHFHCMAHVLLGFHRYLCIDLKKHEQSNDSPVGRDSLPVFKFWSKKGTIAERVLRTTSDIFGPAGDHYGVRDKWEAYCSSKGIKSIIGNYRDNRFNALFQTAGEICVHHTDFLTVLNTVPSPNLKLQAVKADLESHIVKTYIDCLAHLYVKVTGPYWILCSSGTVSYLELHTYIASLEGYLEECSSDPDQILSDTTWLGDEFDAPAHYNRILSALSKIPVTDTLRELISLFCSAMLNTVRKQLSDFLEGGLYSTAPTKEELYRTSYAQVTNLGCEHHFGDLDSSQKRRPNASMHHHSSVQLIKRNGKRVIKWLRDMPKPKQDHVMKLSRAGGKELRKRHKTHEDDVSSEILQDMFNPPKSKRQRTVEIDIDDNYDEIENPAPNLPKIETVNDNEYVAVAYQDAWYPGCVVKSTDNSALVNFMAPCRRKGMFMWPNRKDLQTVDMQFVLMQGLVPECCNSGRQWFFENFKEVDVLYTQYKDRYF